MTTTLLLACLLAGPFACPLAEGPQSSLVGAGVSAAGTGHGRPPLAAGQPAPDAPPAPDDAKPQGEADIPLPAALKEAYAKNQATLDTSEATYKKDVSAALDAYILVLKREHDKAAAVDKQDVTALLQRELAQSFQERDAAVGGNSAAAYKLEMLKEQQATLGKQLDKAVAAEDLRRINELDAEIKKIDAEIGETSREAAAPSSDTRDIQPVVDADSVRQRMANTVCWIAGDYPKAIYFGKNGKWCSHTNNTDRGTWSVTSDGRVSLFHGSSTSYVVWTFTLSGDKIRAARDQGQEFRGRILCPLAEATAKGFIPKQTVTYLGQPASGSAGSAKPAKPAGLPELPLVVAAARTSASRSIANARNARGTAVALSLRQYLQTLVLERQKPGLTGDSSLQIDKELNRVRRLSDDLTGTQLVLEEERRELQELRRTAIKDKDLDLANAADAKIKQLDTLILAGSRPVERAATGMTDAVIFLITAEKDTVDTTAPQVRTYVLESDGQCRMLGNSFKIGKWTQPSAGTLELTIVKTEYKLQIDRNGMISGKSGTQTILGSVYGPVKDWPGANTPQR